MLNSMLQASTLCMDGALDTKSPARLPAEVDLEGSLYIKTGPWWVICRGKGMIGKTLPTPFPDAETQTGCVCCGWQNPPLHLTQSLEPCPSFKISSAVLPFLFK